MKYEMVTLNAETSEMLFYLRYSLGREVVTHTNADLPCDAPATVFYRHWFKGYTHYIPTKIIYNKGKMLHWYKTIERISFQIFNHENTSNLFLFIVFYLKFISLYVCPLCKSSFQSLDMVLMWDDLSWPVTWQKSSGALKEVSFNFHPLKQFRTKSGMSRQSYKKYIDWINVNR